MKERIKVVMFEITISCALNQKAFNYSLILTLTKPVGGQEEEEEEEEEVTIGVLAQSFDLFFLHLEILKLLHNPYSEYGFSSLGFHKSCELRACPSVGPPTHTTSPHLTYLGMYELNLKCLITLVYKIL